MCTGNEVKSAKGTIEEYLTESETLGLKESLKWHVEREEY